MTSKPHDPDKARALRLLNLWGMAAFAVLGGDGLIFLCLRLAGQTLPFQMTGGLVMESAMIAAGALGWGYFFLRYRHDRVLEASPLDARPATRPGVHPPAAGLAAFVTAITGGHRRHPGE